MAQGIPGGTDGASHQQRAISVCLAHGVHDLAWLPEELSHHAPRDAMLFWDTIDDTARRGRDVGNLGQVSTIRWANINRYIQEWQRVNDACAFVLGR